MSNYRQLSDAGDGTILGQSAADLVGFHGSTPTAQGTVVATVSTSAPISGALGFASTAQFTALFGAVNSITDLLKSKGLMASS